MDQDGNRAAEIYRSIGAYLGHALACYYDLYRLQARAAPGPGHVRQGRRPGSGGLPSGCWPTSILSAPASSIPALPDEKSRRVGQSVAAASLPEV